MQCPEALVDRIFEALLQAFLPALYVFWSGRDLVSLCVLVGPGVQRLFVGCLVKEQRMCDGFKLLVLLVHFRDM